MAEPPRKIVAHNVVHLREKPTNDVPLVSQTLMGRAVHVLKTDGNAWSYVETDDRYRGWAEDRWLAAPDPTAVLTPIASVFAEMRAAPSPDAALVLRLPILASVIADPLGPAGGDWVFATLPGCGGGDGGWLPLESLERATRFLPMDGIGSEAARHAKRFLGTPYLWGGSSSFGLDCSGLCQLAYRLIGITLRRDADMQSRDPRFDPVPLDALQPGDLVFYKRLTHVGMALDDRNIIHSAGGAGVIVTPLDDDRYGPNWDHARRLNPARATDPVTPDLEKTLE